MQHSEGRYCSACGYDLTGLEEHRCPECGREFDPAAVWSYVSGRRSGLGPLLLAGPALLALLSPVLILRWTSADSLPWVLFAALCGSGALVGADRWAGRLRRYPPPLVTSLWALRTASIIAVIGLAISAVGLGIALFFAAGLLLFLLLLS